MSRQFWIISARKAGEIAQRTRLRPGGYAAAGGGRKAGRSGQNFGLAGWEGERSFSISFIKNIVVSKNEQI